MKTNYFSFFMSSDVVFSSGSFVVSIPRRTLVDVGVNPHEYVRDDGALHLHGIAETEKFLPPPFERKVFKDKSLSRGGFNRDTPRGGSRKEARAPTHGYWTRKEREASKIISARHTEESFEID
jgi:hypothetical protein